MLYSTKKLVHIFTNRVRTITLVGIIIRPLVLDNQAQPVFKGPLKRKHLLH